MKRIIQVFHDSRPEPIGRLLYNLQGNRENASFEYDASWLESNSHFSIDPELPLVFGAQFHKKVGDGSIFHGAISDTEPDGWGRKVILRDYIKRREIARKAVERKELSPLNDLDFLLAVDDISRVGALRFKNEDGVFCRSSEQLQRRTPPLIELGRLLSASRAVETNTETEEDLRYLQGRATSLDGLRPKCTVVDADGKLSIGKFPSVADDHSVTKGEVLALTLAKRAGINAARAKIINGKNIPVALIQRFDRTATGKRIMYASAATMLGANTKDSSVYSYTDIVDVIRQRSASPKIDILIPSQVKRHDVYLRA